MYVCSYVERSNESHPHSKLCSRPGTDVFRLRCLSQGEIALTGRLQLTIQRKLWVNCKSRFKPTPEFAKQTPKCGLGLKGYSDVSKKDQDPHQSKNGISLMPSPFLQFIKVFSEFALVARYVLCPLKFLTEPDGKKNAQPCRPLRNYLTVNTKFPTGLSLFQLLPSRFLPGIHFSQLFHSFPCMRVYLSFIFFCFNFSGYSFTCCFV